MNQHKHKDLIIEWAKGAIIEFWDSLQREWRITKDNKPLWCDSIKYRVKPPSVIKEHGRLLVMTDYDLHITIIEVDGKVTEVRFEQENSL